MKIAILNSLYPPESRGGAEEAARAQAKKLANQGHEISVVTLKSLNTKSVQENGIKIIGLKHKNIFHYSTIQKKPVYLRFVWHIIDVFNFWLAGDIRRVLEKEGPDLVLGHNLKGLSYLTPKIIKKLGFKYWQIIHDVSLYTPSGLIEYGKEDIWEHSGFLTQIYRFFTRKLFSYAERIIFPSAWLLTFYRKNDFFTDQEKIYKPNDISFSSFKKSGATGKYHESNNFLFVGQLERHKGILFLINVFKNLPAMLDVVGDGSLMEEVKEAIQGDINIKIHGRVKHEELSRFYKKARAVIVPSLVYENSPNVIQEALKFDTPVIVSRIGGAYELINEDINGYTFEPGNIDDLNKKIKNFI